MYLQHVSTEYWIVDDSAIDEIQMDIRACLEQSPGDTFELRRIGASLNLAIVSL